MYPCENIVFKGLTAVMKLIAEVVNWGMQRPQRNAFKLEKIQ